MTERESQPNFEQALEALRSEVQKFESGQSEQEDFPGNNALKAAITVINLLPEAPSNLVGDLTEQSNQLCAEYRAASTDSEKDTVRKTVSKTLEILLSRIDPTRRTANYGRLSPQEKKENQDAIDKLKGKIQE